MIKRSCMFCIVFVDACAIARMLGKCLVIEPSTLIHSEKSVAKSRAPSTKTRQRIASARYKNQ